MKKSFCGNEMDRMPDWSFRIMAFMFNVADRFKSPDRKLDSLDIRPGQTVIALEDGHQPLVYHSSNHGGKKSPDIPKFG